jgi:GPH family glycoside/pentoside/hexuronide:cation symporter
MMMFVLQVLISFVFGPTAPLVFAMYTDAADYSEYKTGRRATGLVMSASTMAQKFGWTIGGALAGWLLAAFGFKANVMQGEEALTGIKMMMSFIPAVGSLLGGILMFFYKLDDNFMVDIEKELAGRRKN